MVTEWNAQSTSYLDQTLLCLQKTLFLQVNNFENFKNVHFDTT